jgi:hypothetical protein
LNRVSYQRDFTLKQGQTARIVKLKVIIVGDENSATRVNELAKKILSQHKVEMLLKKNDITVNNKKVQKIRANHSVQQQIVK